MHFLNVEAGVPSRLLMYTLIYWLCRMHATQLQPHFLVLERSGVNWNAIWLTAVVTRHLNTHYRRRVWRSIWRAAALVSDNLSSVVPYHYWRPIWPEKVPDQGLSLRLRHVCKTWEAGARNFVSMVPGDKVALPSRKEDTRVPFLARSFFFSRRHYSWRDHYTLAYMDFVAKCLKLSSFLTFFLPCVPSVPAVFF